MNRVRLALEGIITESDSEHKGQYFHNKYKPIHDEQGNILRVVCASFNVTEIKKAEKEAEEAKKNFTTIFSTITDPLIVSRISDSQIMEVNEAFSRYTVFAREQLLDKKSTDLDHWLSEGARIVFGEELRRNGKVIDCELEIESAEGKKVTGLFTAHFIPTFSPAGIKEMVLHPARL